MPTLSHQTVKALRENSPEFREFLVYLKAHSEQLDRLSALKNADIDDYYYLVVGRLHAKEIIDTILGPLLEPVDNLPGVNPKEYVVD